MDKIIEIIENITNRKYRGGNDPFYGFFTKIWLSRNVVTTLHKLRNNKEITQNILQESYKNCIINLTTALEVYLNDWAIYLIDEQNYEYKEALKFIGNPKIRLDEVELILLHNRENSDLKIGNIFVRYCNFQNVGKFHEIFSLIIFGKKGMIQPLHFDLQFEIREKEIDRFTYADFNKLLNVVFLRHKYIHDFTFTHELEFKDIISYFEIVERFGYSVLHLMLALFDGKEKYKILPTSNNRIHYEKI